MLSSVLRSKLLRGEDECERFDNCIDDDKFIECAAALKAQTIITGDKEVLAIKEYIGIRILTPQKFLEKYKG